MTPLFRVVREAWAGLRDRVDVREEDVPPSPALLKLQRQEQEALDAAERTRNTVERHLLWGDGDVPKR